MNKIKWFLTLGSYNTVRDMAQRAAGHNGSYLFVSRNGAVVRQRIADGYVDVFDANHEYIRWRAGWVFRLWWVA